MIDLATEITRPIMRYHGGKFRMAPWIISHFPRHKVYVEPFGGGGSVLLRKLRSYAEVYNDLDGEVVNLFRVTRDMGPLLRQKLQLTPFSRDEFIRSYIPSDDPLEQARRTVIRSFMGFGSNSHNRPTGFRSNSNRSGTTPSHDWKNYPEALDAIISRLRGVVIENRDAISVMKQHDGPDTVFYIDPPYVLSTRDAGHDYRHEMTDADHEHLAIYLGTVEGRVVVSGYRSLLYDRLYAGWHRVDRRAFADGALARVESLWLSPNSPCHGLFPETLAEVAE